MAKQPAVDRIVLTFDLHDLPTAQHRAGLGGLLLVIDSMKAFRRYDPLIPEVESVTSSSARIAFSRESMQGVFDELYAARPIEVVVEKPWKKAVSKPGEFFVEKRDAKSGQVKRVPGFAYDLVQPVGTTLDRHLSDDAKPWLDLWRQMIWAIPRGGNNVRARAPFIDRAKDKPCGEGRAAWEGLVKAHSNATQARYGTAAITGALMLGTQAKNAEEIPFAGRLDQNILLHFWQVVVMTFEPYLVDKKERKLKRHGFVLAIPDIADLGEFLMAFPEILGSLSTRKEARIDLPAQASLEVLRRLKQRGVTSTAEPDGTGTLACHPERAAHGTRAGLLGADRSLGSEWTDSVRAIESFHVVKTGNNIKLVSFDRVADRPGLIAQYEQINRVYRNPLFRSALMKALVRSGSWYAGMVELFAEYPAPFFMEGGDTPKFLPRFGKDARSKLQVIGEDTRSKEFQEMSDDERLATIVQRLVNKYVQGRAEAKTGKKAKDFALKQVEGKEVRIYPEEFREAQQRVCSDAFLAMRSRHDQDFVEYFVGTVCSVAQYLKPAEYQFLTHLLLTRPSPNPVGPQPLNWEDVKAVAMIAVSACAFNVRPREPQTQRSQS